MIDIEHRFLEVNGIRMHMLEAGTGPLVLMLHGFPETSYSYRHQIVALAEAGFHAVAPDQRGYPRTEQPPSVDDYTIHHVIGDAVGLINGLGASDAVVAGHDWGSPVAWGVAQCRPDLVRGVASLSVPFSPRTPVDPLDAVRAAYGDNFYQLYFQEPGVAEREFESDTARMFRRMWLSFRRTRLHRISQLVSQHHPQLGADHFLGRPPDHRAGDVHRWRPRSGSQLVRPRGAASGDEGGGHQPDLLHDADRCGTLDSAGAPRRDERSPDRSCAVGLLSRRQTGRLEPAAGADPNPSTADAPHSHP
ncbi:alpha/beta hydrolase [Actinoplanes sp. M2I2]|uniref:alpha/beta hydrolase n=1 Tax=Actinoplanes sp. M2I2 TaxID=1734444 RepID=UPI0020220CA8|nr:alpha/beta fold hydrolase [Actinoplanes sp. M2I2]